MPHRYNGMPHRGSVRGMTPKPSPSDLVGFDTTAGQLIAAGCLLAFIVVFGFWLASRRRSGK